MPVRIVGDIFIVGGGPGLLGKAGVEGVGAVYLVRDGDFLCLVDSGGPNCKAQLKESLALLGHDLSQVRLLINTHAQHDHAGGNAFIHECSNCEIASHRDDAEAIEKLYGSPPVSRFLGEGDIVRLDRLEFRVLHTPGHTPGSICLYGEVAGKRVLFTGDAWGWFSPHWGSDYEKLVASTARLAELQVDIILGGHDVVWTDAQGVLKRVAATVRRGIFALVG